MKLKNRFILSACLVLAIAVGFLVFTSIKSDSKQGNLSPSAGEIAQQRGLSPDDVEAALKTFVPTGKYDDYLMFSSGGQSGQVLVIGVPSMRLLKVIAAFTPEPWQGFGTGSKETEELLRSGDMPIGKDRKLTWADTHHPALSETNGDYDGQFLFINDKANARIAVIDLRDFETKQIIKSPNLIVDHGSTFVTPNTEYVIQGAQYGTPIPYTEYAPIEQYQEKYRGMVGFYKFNRKKGKIDLSESFQIELPPYWQDLCDAGKKVSEGWVFCGSLNSEMATGGFGDGKPPFEAGVSQRDMDYLHVINWKKAAEVVKAGKAKTISGIKVISLQTAIDEGLLYFIPEPKSPHGADVSPDGNYIVISGKLDTHNTIFGFDKIQKAISSKNYEGKDPYGVPILNFKAVTAAQLEIGLGPLHTQFDNEGYAYTSVFIESTMAKWTLGEPYHSGDKAWKLVEKIPVHYNIGHLVCAEGDTVSPDGKYCVALNKWAIDRFTPVGPLHPQNFQLIDVSGSKMQRLYDMPIGIGEPHYVQMIKADKLNPWLVYPEMGFNTLNMSVDPKATKPGKEGIVRNGNNVDVYMTAIRSHFNPEHIKVQEGDNVRIHITSIERARDATHGFAINGYNINLSLEPGEANTVEFVADKPGVYPFFCTEFCSALHLEMAGYLLVEPKK
jgi:nitrous-oxide reductase